MWGAGATLGLGLRLGSNWGLDLRYGVHRLREHFAFAALDTITGLESVRSAIEYRTPGNALLRTEYVETPQRYERTRREERVNLYLAHEVSFGVSRAFGSAASRLRGEFGLRGGITFGGTAQGRMLGPNGEVDDLSDATTSASAVTSVGPAVAAAYDLRRGRSILVSASYLQALETAGGSPARSRTLSIGLGLRFGRISAIRSP